VIQAAAARWTEEEDDYCDDITMLCVRLNEVFNDKGKPDPPPAAAGKPDAPAPAAEPPAAGPAAAAS